MLAWCSALGCAAWAFGARHFDFSVAKTIVPWAFAAAIIAAIVFLRGAAKKLGAVFLAFDALADLDLEYPEVGEELAAAKKKLLSK
jgi:hypothetical protein